MQQMEKFYIVSRTSCLFIDLIPVKTRSRILKFVHCILCSVHNYILYLPIIHPFMSNISMYGFRVKYCIIIISVVCCVIFCQYFHMFHCYTHCFLLLHSHVVSYLLTPSSRVLKKLTGSQLVKKFTSF
jgi:uncharacterized membrane protein